MSNNVVHAQFMNMANPDHVLDACKGEFEAVLVMGWDKDGQFGVMATANLRDGGDLLWLVEQFKFNLMHGVYEK